MISADHASARGRLAAVTLHHPEAVQEIAALRTELKVHKLLDFIRGMGIELTEWQRMYLAALILNGSK